MRHHCSISNARSSAQTQTCVRRRWRSRCQKIRWSVRGPVDTCDNVLKKVPFSEFRGYSYLARPSRARLTRRSGLTVRLTAVRACAARVRDVPPSRGPPGRPWSAWLRSDGPLPDARGAAGRRRGRVGPRGRPPPDRVRTLRTPRWPRTDDTGPVAPHRQQGRPRLGTATGSYTQHVLLSRPSPGHAKPLSARRRSVSMAITACRPPCRTHGHASRTSLPYARPMGQSLHFHLPASMPPHHSLPHDTLVAHLDVM